MKTQKRAYRTVVFISLILCEIIVFWGGQVSADEWTSAQKEVWKTIENTWESFKQGKLDETLYFEGNVEWLSEARRPHSGDILKSDYEGWFAMDKPVSYEIEPFEIFIFGNVANVFYGWKWKGDTLSDSGRQLDVLIQQDNKWKFITGMNCSCKQAPKCP